MSRTHVARQDKMSGKKKAAMITAIALTLALLIGGVFAWTDFSQYFINRQRGSSDNDVMLHDDFEPGVNKDVYVENLGQNPIIVRVQFREFFQIGDTIISNKNGTNINFRTPRVYNPDGSVDETKSWPVHNFPGAAMLGTGEWGQFDGACTAGGATHGYWEWLMTGADKAYKSGISKQGNYSYTYTDGSDGIFMTLDAKPVVTIAWWNAHKSDVVGTDLEGNDIYLENAVACWILDTDGWCYWSQPLLPDTATNLLLDNIRLVTNPDDNWAYYIDVHLQASNKTEIDDMKATGGTTAGKNLMDAIVGRIATATPPVAPPEPPEPDPYPIMLPNYPNSTIDPEFKPSYGPDGTIRIRYYYSSDNPQNDSYTGAMFDAYPLEKIFGPDGSLISFTDITGVKINEITFESISGNTLVPFVGPKYTEAILSPNSSVGISFTATDMIAKLVAKWELVEDVFYENCVNYGYQNVSAACNDIIMHVEVQFEVSDGSGGTLLTSPFVILINHNGPQIN